MNGHEAAPEKTSHTHSVSARLPAAEEDVPGIPSRDTMMEKADGHRERTVKWEIPDWRSKRCR
jgi:hypothetical protein